MHETPSLTKNLQSSDEYSDKPRPAETNKVSILGYQENLHPLASSEVDFRGMGLLQTTAQRPCDVPTENSVHYVEELLLMVR